MKRANRKSKSIKRTQSTPQQQRPTLSVASGGGNLDFLTNPDFSSQSATVEQVMMLQRTLGNQATGRILRGELTLQRDGKRKGKSGGGMTAAAMTGIVEDEVTLLQKASKAYEDDALRIMNALAGEAPGSKLMAGPVKTIPRILEKAKKKATTTRDDGTSAMSLSSSVRASEDIKDVLRCTLVFDDFRKLAKGYKKVARALQSYRTGIVVGIVKMDSWFGEGRETASGYRDAKIVFQVQPSPAAGKHLKRMMRSLPALSIEMQFNVRAALAVKDGKVHGKGEEAWNFEMDAPAPLKHKFNALGFLEKLLGMTAEDAKFARLNGEIEAFIEGNRAELDEGLPIAHHLYEPEKVQAMADATGRSPRDITSHYNDLYRQIYAFAYRASKFRLSSIDPATGEERETSGKGLDDAFKSMKKRYIKS